MTMLLEVEELRTTFATEDGVVTAVDGVTFSVRRGEVVGIVGESGCGKSVTAESIMRLLDEASTEYEGQIRFEGETDLLALSDEQMREYRGGRIGMIFQDPMSSLNPVYTIGYQLTEALLTHTDLGRHGAYKRALEVLRLTRIPQPELRMKQYPHELSGGQRQRVVIAMALCCEPDLLIADEPTTALDVTTQSQILVLMEDLRKKFDTGTLFITHDLGVVAEICDRVIVMYLGQVIEETDVFTLFDNPAHPYTRGLLASTPSAHTDNSQPLPVIPGAVPTLREVPFGCRFAPRCPFAISACREAPVELREFVSDDARSETLHKVRCIRAEEISTRSPRKQEQIGADTSCEPLITGSPRATTADNSSSDEVEPL